METDDRTETRARSHNFAAQALLALGLLQLAGHLAGVPALKGLGAATAASPLPKVFSDVRGLETFATEFDILYETEAGSARVRITPDLYQKLGGPYNRRNVYGAALSFGPRLPRTLWEPILCYALKRGGPFYAELGLPQGARQVRVEIRAKTRGRSDAWLLEPSCRE